MMMKDISLHVLDIVNNSIAAGASFIQIEIRADRSRDWMSVSVQDNGCGMGEELLQRVQSPFTTSRKTRNVGLGIPFFKAGAEAAGGAFSLTSKVGEGTLIKGEYTISHLDRPPMGDIAETLLALIVASPGIDFRILYSVDANEFNMDTREIRSILGADVPLNLPDVIEWIRDYLKQGISELNGGI